MVTRPVAEEAGNPLRLVAAGLLISLVLEISGLKLRGAVPAALALGGSFVLRYVIVMANA
jgi:hypothetical protein